MIIRTLHQYTPIFNDNFFGFRFLNLKTGVCETDSNREFKKTKYY